MKCNKDCFNCVYPDCIYEEPLRQPLSEEQRQRHNQYQREIYCKRKKRGVCVKCGRNSTVAGTVHCDECRMKRRKYDRKYRLKKRGDENRTMPLRDIWKESGLCYRCGSPVSDRCKSNGIRKVMLCERCYQKMIEAQRKAVEKIKNQKNAMHNGNF